MHPTVGRALLRTTLALGGLSVSDRHRRLEASQWWPGERIRQLQAERLRRVIRGCWRIPFYAERFRAAGLPEGYEPAALEGLALFPLLDKDDLGPLRASLAPPQGRSDFVRRSSGTSGHPVTVLSDRAAQTMSLAVRWRALAWFSIGPGEPQARFWGRPARGERYRRLRDALLNRITFTAADLEPGAFASTAARLRRQRPTLLYGYASLLVELADCWAATGTPPLRPAPRAIVCTAEGTLPHERQRLAEIFGCPAVQEYGSSETDILAHECPAGGLHLMCESSIVEVWPGREETDGGRGPRTGDEAGGEAVVTDLSNLRMPLLRYRLGDWLRLGHEPCCCGRSLPLITSLEGRSRDRFVELPGGRRGHASTFAHVVEHLVGQGLSISRFQVTQEADGSLTARFVLRQGELSDAAARLESAWRAEISRAFGPGLRCRIELVDRIPRSPAGKASYFLPSDQG